MNTSGSLCEFLSVGITSEINHKQEVWLENIASFLIGRTGNLNSMEVNLSEDIRHLGS